MALGGADAWLAHYDGAGNQSWIRQIGTSSLDQLLATASDGSGGVYVSGDTSGDLGATNAGDTDAWFARYDGAGNQTWVRQIGTSDSDTAWAIASNGSGGVFVSGTTLNDLGGPSAGIKDAWLASCDSAGTQTWIRQFGTSGSDTAFAAAADGTVGVYVCGYTTGSLGAPSAGGDDIWLARYDNAGTQTWIRQFGMSSSDYARAIAPDGTGGVYLTGFTTGSLGAPSAGGNDIWLARYDSTGNQTWIHQIGTALVDYSLGLAQAGSSGVYVVGETTGSLGGPSAGNYDVWFALYDGPCPLPTVYCTAKLNSLGCLPSIAASGLSSAAAAGGFVVRAGSVRNNKGGVLV
jgi:hypothetical protein